MKVEHGLVPDNDLFAVERRAELDGQSELRRAVMVVPLVVERNSGAGLLGPVHGDVGLLQENFDSGAVHREQREADAGLRADDQLLELERLTQGIRKPLGCEQRL